MSAEYVLLAEVFYLRQEDGSRKRYRTGDVVEVLNDEQVERLLRAKAIGSADDLPEPEPVDDEGEGEAGDDKPTEDAKKPELVEWVFANVSKADGSDYSKSELNRMNKDELVEIIESVD